LRGRDATLNFDVKRAVQLSILVLRRLMQL